MLEELAEAMGIRSGILLFVLAALALAAVVILDLAARSIPGELWSFLFATLTGGAALSAPPGPSAARTPAPGPPGPPANGQQG